MISPEDIQPKARFYKSVLCSRVLPYKQGPVRNQLEEQTWNLQLYSEDIDIQSSDPK